LVLAMGFLSAVFFWPIDSYQMGTFGLTMLYVGFGIILWLALVFEEQILQLNWLVVKIIKVFSIVGYYSYSIYLFHTMVGAFVMPIVFKASPIKLSSGILFLFYFIFSIGIGIIMSKIIERPFLNLREKYFKSLT
jgi:peptidoglycan/LPS O-acetylase OafA/YrhL